MTRYIAAYDTESPRCLAACRTIVEMHRKHAMPATFFITGKTLEADPEEYRRLLDDPLFEIASHTYSHKSLRDHPFCGPAVPLEEIREELLEAHRIKLSDGSVSNLCERFLHYLEALHVSRVPQFRQLLVMVVRGYVNAILNLTKFNIFDVNILNIPTPVRI